MTIEQSDFDDIVQSAIVVDLALRSYFPDSYFMRCMYAAKATEHVLKSKGHVSYICGGDLEAIMARKDGTYSRAGFFGDGKMVHGHFWACTGSGFLVDLGLHYLPIERKYKGHANAPYVVWPLSDQEMDYCKHTLRVRIVPGGNFTDTPFREKIGGLLRICDDLLHGDLPPMKTPWIMSGHQSVLERSRQGDFWAKAAIRSVIP